MSGRLRVAGAVVATAAGLAALGAGHWAARRVARDWATRAAHSAAAYLVMVAPTATGASNYDLARLLAQARGLASLQGWTGAVEVYYGTAPLVRATAAPLDAAAFATLRVREIAQALGDAQLVPLKDKDDGDVVGAVAVRVGDVTPSLLSGWTLALLLVLGVTGALAADQRRKRRVAVVLGLTAVLTGITGYRVTLTGARGATDTWLMQARDLLGEVGARVPTRNATAAVGRLGSLVRGAELAVGDSGDTAVQRAMVPAGPRASTRVQLRSGRWLVLSVLPGEATIGGWLPVTLGLAALGVVGVLIVAWIARARTRPLPRSGDPASIKGTGGPPAW